MSRLRDATRIVLVEPSLPDNVGSVARAMAHFGLHELVLVGGVDPLHPLAVRVAAGHDAVLAAARKVDTLTEALRDTVLVVGTTAHTYERPDLQLITAHEAAALASEHAAAGAVAIVFGTEKHGLPREALQRAHQLARIPGEEGTCLNLAMAVHVFAYEWYLAGDVAAAEAPLLAGLAATGELEALAAALGARLQGTGLWKPHEAASKGHTLRRILSRTRVSPDELALLRALAHGLTRPG